MGRKFLLFVWVLFSVQVFAQTGIGTTTPNASAKLDVFSTNKGFLPPRVTLTSVSDATTIASPAEGLLVYNLGSVGLQAGYYYWNGANWATIATATSAGNGVTASDMVKLYGEAHSSGTNKISSSTGYVFTVPVSGKYLFDFTSTATALGGGTNTIYFQVRQGTTVLGSDNQSSYNNNVHVEYNGKVEVNLQAGVSYNVYNYATSGSFEANDYDRVYYKQVSGNLPVTGQSVDYVSVSRTTLQTVNTGDNILFNSINSGNIPYNSTTGNFTLTAGKTYRLTGSVSLDATTSASSEIDIAWKNAAGDVLGNKALILSANFASPAGGNGITDIIYTPTVNTTIALNVIAATTNAKTIPNYTYANVEQIGSSAYVTPWTLSGTSTYNTTGNVGIGTNAPTSTLEVNGSVKANTLSLVNSTIGTPSLVLKNGDAAASYSDIAQLKMGWSGSAAGKSQYAHFIHTRHNAGTNGNAIDFYLSNGTADNTIANGSTLAMTLTSPGEISIPGTMTSSGYVTSSDSRLKTNIIDISNALDTLSLLRPVKYLKKYDLPGSNYRKKELGFIAQEVQQVLPYLVTEGNDKDKLLSLDYISLIPLLTKAIQEQEIKFKKLNQERDLLEKRMQIIQRHLLKLEKKK
jgi:uncharacterized protein YdeI (BOF family)